MQKQANCTKGDVGEKKIEAYTAANHSKQSLLKKRKTHTYTKTKKNRKLTSSSALRVHVVNPLRARVYIYNTNKKAIR